MKKVYFITILLGLIFSINSMANEITAIKASKNMENGLLVIDVRNKEEWQETGIIPNSILIQMLSSARTIRKEYVSELLTALGDDKDINVAIICHSGGRSSATVSLLQDRGVNNIFNISEGMVGNGSTTGWVNRNLPVIECNEECK